MPVIRYFLVGGTAALVDFLGFALLNVLIGIHWFYAALLSFVLATIVNYLLSIRFVFSSGSRFGKRSEIGLVFLVSGLGLGFNQLIMWLLINGLALLPVMAKLVATGCVFFWNYSARRYWIFGSRHA